MNISMGPIIKTALILRSDTSSVFVFWEGRWLVSDIDYITNEGETGNSQLS